VVRKLICISILFLSITCHSQTVSDLRPTVTMKEYVDMNVDWQQKYNNAQLASLKEANELVRLSLQEYKTVNNEWRGQMKDQTSTYVTKSELWLAVSTIISLTIAALGLLSRRKRETETLSARNIQSGDTVEVKK
jgi:hypothetical protein